MNFLKHSSFFGFINLFWVYPDPNQNILHLFFWYKFKNSKIINSLHEKFRNWRKVYLKFNEETYYLENSHSLKDLFHTCRYKEIGQKLSCHYNWQTLLQSNWSTCCRRLKIIILINLTFDINWIGFSLIYYFWCPTNKLLFF